MMLDRALLTRRALVHRASTLAAFAIATPWLGSCVPRRRALGEYPFKLGVASGDPVSDGFVLWTRLAPFPFDPDRAGHEPIAVTWRVASDERMRKPVATGTALARPDHAFAVHVEVRGLEPGRPYWYQFSCRDDESVIGKTRTAPIVGAKLDKLRFAFASCQHYEHGYYGAYRDMREAQPDLVLHLGDYIYESSWGVAVRRHDGPETLDLAQYRARHALYKTDPALQAMHAACPWLVTWDDHEVENDWAGDVSATGMETEAFVKRRTAALQAYWEHMPLRRTQALAGLTMNLASQSVWGDLVTIALADTRQFRSPQACPLAPDRRGGHLAPIDTCTELKDSTRTMLGLRQEASLARILARGGVIWSVLAQSVLFSGLRQRDAEGRWSAWTDQWDGYMSARARLVDHLMATKVPNPIVLAGDIHSFWTNDVKAAFEDPTSPVVGTEFVTGAISSALPPPGQFEKVLPDNPHVKFFDGGHHGYGLCDVTPTQWRTEYRTVDSVVDPKAGSGPRTAFVVEKGRPGAVRA